MQGPSNYECSFGWKPLSGFKSQMDADIVHSPEKFIYDLSHLVVNEENTLFFKVFEEDFYVNSMHHQAIKDLAKRVKKSDKDQGMGVLKQSMLSR